MWTVGAPLAPRGRKVARTPAADRARVLERRRAIHKAEKVFSMLPILLACDRIPSADSLR